MENFVFHNPTKVLFGQNTLASIGPETALLGKNILLVYGRESIKKNTIYTQVTESLSQAGVSVIEHGGVRSNPVLSHARAGIELATKHKVDAVVAVGGGSVIDSAKAICAGALVDHDVWKFFIGKKSIREALPLACVLTLAASGSEMNSGMVLTNDETRTKLGFANRHLFPRVSILDPTATFTVPGSYTAYGAVDAITHLLEFYFTTELEETPIQDRLTEGLVLSIMESCEQALAHPTGYQARARLMWAATLALNGLTSAGLGKIGFPMHLLEHPLSARYDVPHGAGLSVIVPAWLTWQSRRNPKKIAQFAERVFGIQNGDTAASARTGIAALKGWFEKIGSPVSLAQIDVPQSALPLLAEDAMAQAAIWRMREYDKGRILEIYNCL